MSRNPLRLGIIARAEDRGLGIQTWEACRHLNPDRVLLIDPGDAAGGFPQHTHRFAPTKSGGEHAWALWTVPWSHGTLPEEPVREFLKGLDVVYTAETFYDWRIPEWAAEAGVGAVCHVNPELYPNNRGNLPITWWSATNWRLDFLPPGTRVVPMPVATERFAHATYPGDRPVRFLHVAGHRAHADRNGTTTVFRASRHMRSTATLIIRGQDEVLPVEQAPGPGVELLCEPHGVANYWRLYADADVLVMPRRYGGLCLPVQEAAAAGLALVLSDCEPNRMWPGVHVPTRILTEIQVPHGRIPLHEVHDGELAEVLDTLADDPDRVRQLQVESLQWAAAHSWSALTERWWEELARARRR